MVQSKSIAMPEFPDRRTLRRFHNHRDPIFGYVRRAGARSRCPEWLDLPAPRKSATLHALDGLDGHPCRTKIPEAASSPRKERKSGSLTKSVGAGLRRSGHRQIHLATGSCETDPPFPICAGTAQTRFDLKTKLLSIMGHPSASLRSKVSAILSTKTANAQAHCPQRRQSGNGP